LVAVGFYKYQDEVGYRGWVTFDKAVAFERTNGEVVVIKKPQ
jgi:hypothetical protein